MKRSFVAVAIAVIGTVAMASAQAPGAAGERFGLGTFQYQGKTFFGLALRDAFVVDLAAAAAAAKVQVPTDMMAIIQQYDSGVGDRLKAIVKNVASQLGANRPAYVYDLKAVKALPPFTPTGIVQARSNYLEHFLEMGGGAARQNEVNQQNRAQAQQVLEKPPPSMPGYWERAATDKRQNPYLFANVPTIVSGDGDQIEVPVKRSRIDYECEMVAVMGARPARRVSPERAKDYVFGYAVLNDVTDREGRSEGGSDWLIGKGIDTFKPFGPYVTPKEFVDPLNIPIKFTLSGRVLQDDTTGSAIHSIYELIQYASNLFTLKAGNMVALGTPSGVGTARKPPVYMKAGDTAVCTYTGLGTLTNPVVAERAPATSSASQ